jgi:mono/diheme cytochrome c family protein
VRASLLLTAAIAALVLAVPADGLAKKGKSGKAPAGDKLFAENCAYCHGNGGKGDGPNAARLTPAPVDLTKIDANEDGIAGVVRNGKGSCPSWRASLSDEEIAAVARFASSLQR